MACEDQRKARWPAGDGRTGALLSGGTAETRDELTAAVVKGGKKKKKKPSKHG